MFKTLLKSLVGAAALTGLTLTANAGIIDDIKARGTIKVGVKADYRPYGYREPSGKIVGIEPDLAKEVADKLGVKIEYVPVVGSNRMQFLSQGKIDMMIATMTDRPDRRKVVWIVTPNYYSSGTNIIALKSHGFKKWEDLRAKPVCGIQGAFYNKKTGREFGAKIVAFKGTAEVYTALKANRCVAFVYDDSAIVAKLAEKDWADYEMPLPTIDDAAWGLAVKHGDKDLHDFMAEMIRGWHASGRILELEKKWGVANTPFAKHMHAEWRYFETGK